MHMVNLRMGRREAVKVTTNPEQSPDFSYIRRLEGLSDRQAALNWGLGFALVVSVGINLYYAATERVQVQFVQFDSAERMMVRMFNDLQDKGVRQQLTEGYLTQYVIDRETIDHATETSRFERVRMFTDGDYFGLFRDEMTLSNKNSPLVRFANAPGGPVAREVFITGIVPVAGSEDTYLIDYMTVDRQAKQEISRANWQVSLRFMYRQMVGGPDEVRINPIGLTVGPYAPRPRTLSDLNAVTAAQGDM